MEKYSLVFCMVIITIGSLLKVDVCITARRAGLPVSTDPDGVNVACRAELFLKHGLCHIRVQISHIQ